MFFDGGVSQTHSAGVFAVRVYGLPRLTSLTSRMSRAPHSMHVHDGGHVLATSLLGLGGEAATPSLFDCWHIALV